MFDSDDDEASTSFRKSGVNVLRQRAFYEDRQKSVFLFFPKILDYGMDAKWKIFTNSILSFVKLYKIVIRSTVLPRDFEIISSKS